HEGNQATDLRIGEDDGNDRSRAAEHVSNPKDRAFGRRTIVLVENQKCETEWQKAKMRRVVSVIGRPLELIGELVATACTMGEGRVRAATNAPCFIKVFY